MFKFSQLARPKFQHAALPLRTETSERQSREIGGQRSMVFLADFHKSAYRLMLVETLGHGIYSLCFMGNQRILLLLFFWIYT